MPEAEFDRAKAKAFTQLMVRHLEGAAVSVMLEIGRRVGLFEAMAKMGPAISEGIAETAGLNERYVRGWLAGHGRGRLRDEPGPQANDSSPPPPPARLPRAQD